MLSRSNRFADEVTSNVFGELCDRWIPQRRLLFQRSEQDRIQIATELMLSLAILDNEAGKRRSLFADDLDQLFTGRIRR
jgi:hypothetical protein